jgi:hypothetical protein
MGTTVPPIVSDDENLPEELKGKTPAEIVDYYRRREQQYVNKIEDLAARTPVTTPVEPVRQNTDPTPSEVWSDPIKAIKQVGVTREEFNAAAGQVQANMIEMAAIIVGKRIPDFAKWEAKVRNIMANVAPHLKADPQQWETAYYYVKGQETDKLVNEAAANAVRVASEVPSMTPTMPVIPEKLTFEENYVAKGLGLSDEQYKDGKQQEVENSWPLTFDSRKRKVGG